MCGRAAAAGAHFAQRGCRPPAAAVEADEAARLELLAPGRGFLVVEPAVAQGVVEPDVLDRAVLGAAVP